MKRQPPVSFRATFGERKPGTGAPRRAGRLLDLTPTMEASSESEVIAQELSTIAGKVGALETRLREVEAVIERLEAAAETTARALEEVSSHWDAVYRAMRRAE